MLGRKFILTAAVVCLLLLTTVFVYPRRAEGQEGVLAVNPVPLPGEDAMDFETAAVVGEEIKKIKLSDFRGKWVYLTFIPAAFTFV